VFEGEIGISKEVIQKGGGGVTDTERSLFSKIIKYDKQSTGYLKQQI